MNIVNHLLIPILQKCGIFDADGNQIVKNPI